VLQRPNRRTAVELEHGRRVAAFDEVDRHGSGLRIVDGRLLLRVERVDAVVPKLIDDDGVYVATVDTPGGRIAATRPLRMAQEARQRFETGVGTRPRLAQPAATTRENSAAPTRRDNDETPSRDFRCALVDAALAKKGKARAPSVETLTPTEGNDPPTRHGHEMILTPRDA
jgi:hypothetical protein